MKDYCPIANYGLIGNMHTVALVSMNGSMDYLPLTRFDSPTIFAALLDKDRGGHWQIKPCHPETNCKQLYLPDTGVLITRFFTPEGMGELTDFMPIRQKDYSGAVVRMLKVIKGRMTFHMKFRPRLDYARANHEVLRENGALLIRSKGADRTVFRFITDQQVLVQNGDITGEWTMEQGDQASCVIEAVPQERSSFKGRELQYFTETSFQDTVMYWQKWSEQSTYQGRWREMVLRSSITLKMMTSLEFGSPVAAATFGLPEVLGGERNWDYRFTWIRDAAFTMYAFLRLGFTGEAKHFMQWIMVRCKDMQRGSDLQLMYAVDGETQLQEQVLDHLEGYKGSRPVRIGNGAYSQFQLDIYGELIDTIYLYNKHGGPITYDFWKDMTVFVDYVAENWQQPDHGIWEVRNEKKEFLYSKVMAWVALDRAIRIAQSRSFPAPLEQWLNTRNAIYQDVYENYWSEERQAFVQYRGATVLDAAALVMPLVRMLSPEEPRWQATLKAIEENLVTDSLVYRYSTEHGATDGLGGTEGTFSICSFWYIENLSKAGQVDKARLMFEKMLGYANHLGLYSEEIGLQGELLGNFPQAFTHLALISAAVELNNNLPAPRRTDSNHLHT